MKFVFWALLAANAALLAYGQGMLGQPGAGEREPGRGCSQTDHRDPDPEADLFSYSDD